jgi:hypothetical protein
MAVYASAVGAAILGEAAVGTIGAGLLGGAVIGAGAGALYSGITGDGNILNSALTGGLIGAGVGGLGAAAGPTLMGTAGSAAPTAATIAGTANTPALASSTLTAATLPSAVPEVASGTSAFGGTGGASVSTIPGYVAAPSTVTNSALLPTQMAELDAAGYGGMSNGVLNQVPGTAAFNPAPYLGNQVASGLTGKEMLGYGLAGTAAMSLLGGMNQKKIQTGTTGTQNQAMIRPYTYNVSQNPSAYATGPQYGANGLPILPTSEKKYFNQSYTAGTPYKAAAGGLMAEGGITYDPATQTYKGLPQVSQPPLVEGPQLSPDQVSKLTPQYQAANPHAFSYDAKTQRYGAATPTMQQLNAFQTQLDQNNAAQQSQGSYDGSNSNGAANGGLMYAKGGKSEDDGFSFDDLTKAQKEYYLDMMAAPMTAPKMQGADVGSSNSFEKYMMSQMPRGAFGRAGVTRPMDDGSSLRAGISGIAMAQPGRQGITAMPGNVDVGYNAPVGAGNVDLSAYRSVNPMPGRGHAQGINARYTLPFAMGGGIDSGYNLGSYSDGGRLLKGPGDGVSDDIPAVIGQKQPARLADGEFVIPARIVSEIGNGSTDAGAKRLYSMMDKIQAGRKKSMGKNNVAKDTKAKKHLLA